MTGRILVVDDVATNRIIMRVKLSAACYDVIQASGGQEALEIARLEQPDLILLDMAMPDIDGREVCRRLKADPATAEIPVVIVTAHVDTRSRLDALAAGAEDFLTKPVDDAILLARLRSLLRARSIAAELTLREGTSHALGVVAAAAEFGTLDPPGRVAIVAGNADLASVWQEKLFARLGGQVHVTVPARLLRDGGYDRPPDVILLSDTLVRPGDGLSVLAELRARPATRHAAIVVVVPPEARDRAAMALDLGASDLLMLPMEPAETALRLRTQLTRKRQADRLRARLRDGLELAMVDPLTELYNRRYGLAHLRRVHDRALARGRGYALLLVDLDRFKSVNDRYGHAAGDTVLGTVAGRLRARLRGVDLISRIGGEEFMIVMPEMGLEAAQGAAERLCAAVAGEATVLPDGTRIAQTVSIGVALGGLSATETVEEAMARADRALYVAKSGGRNRTHLDRSGRIAAA